MGGKKERKKKSGDLTGEFLILFKIGNSPSPGGGSIGTPVTFLNGFEEI